MADQINVERGISSYDRLYAQGGWKYSFRQEYRWHRREVIKRFGLRRGARMLEVACGNGFHTDVFNRMGFDCVGIDRSEMGITKARERFPKWNYLCCDLRDMPFNREEFDVVIARGCSHYHYDLLSDIALETTDLLSKLLRPGGVFIMIIVSDLSGSREPDQVWHNVLDDYRRHFSSRGKRWSVDWVDGMVICGLYNEPVPVDSQGSVMPDKSAIPVHLE